MEKGGGIFDVLYVLSGKRVFCQRLGASLLAVRMLLKPTMARDGKTITVE
jgi:hypothetical protein